MDNNVSYQDEKIKFEDIIEKNVDLSKYTSMGTGGKAQYLTTPGRFEELITALKFAKENNLKITIIGAGSNILVSDKGIEGLIIRTHHLSRFSTKGNMFCCRAGMSIEKAINITLDDSMFGLEGLSGIPGSIGGAIIGNSGANGHLISDHLLYVDYITFDGKTHRMGTQVINFGYRYSSFLDIKDCIIFEAGFGLSNSTDSFKKSREEQSTIKKDRKEKGLFDYSSAGSIFKNPEGKYTAGELIDSCKLKSKKIGGAMVSPKHANLIVNYKNASSTDIYKLAELCRGTVEKKTGIKLEYEIKLLGDFT